MVGCVCVSRLSEGRLAPQAASSSEQYARPATESLCRMRLRPCRIGDREYGHADPEMRSRVFAIDDLDGAAMGIHELEHHRKADARSLDLYARGRAAGVEGFEYAGALIGRNPG